MHLSVLCQVDFSSFFDSFTYCSPVVNLSSTCTLCCKMLGFQLTALGNHLLGTKIKCYVCQTVSSLTCFIHLTKETGTNDKVPKYTILK